MLRRVTVNRPRGLLVVGVVLLLWWSVSYLFAVKVSSPWSFYKTVVELSEGLLVVAAPARGDSQALVAIARVSYSLSPSGAALYPTWGTNQYLSNAGVASVTWIAVPLWLLAFLCLAWPVTSFILARRRRKGRGFEVQTADTADA